MAPGNIAREKMNKEQLLEKTEFFHDIGDAGRKEVAALAKFRVLRRRQVLFTEAAEGSSFYVLSRGAVKLTKTTHEGQEVSVKIVHPFEVFAEAVLFENPAYPVSAVTLIPSEVLEIKRLDFVKQLDDPDFRDEFIAMLMKKQRYLAQRLLELTRYDVEERFVRFLSDRYGQQENYTIPLSKQDVAAAIGTIPETLSRIILRLHRRGILEWKKSKLKLRPGFWDDIPPL